MKKRYKDLTGQRFGYWTVIRRSTRTDAKNRAYWVCVCDCGHAFTVRGDQLRLGTSTRCSYCKITGGRKSQIFTGEERT